MNKRALIEKIIARLDEDLASFARSARDAHEEATHEQNKAENKYDTRGLEASYLARGQSRQATETGDARRQFEALAIRDFAPDEPIDLGALVELAVNDKPMLYFVGPRAGGMEIRIGREKALVITLQSPLGQQLLGKRVRDRWRNPISGLPTEYCVLRVF